jgi:hypothetical protein
MSHYGTLIIIKIRYRLLVYETLYYTFIGDALREKTTMTNKCIIKKLN